ncbi:MAG: hypothetical protein ACHRXM_17530 [Isosphaerales bacterium]
MMRTMYLACVAALLLLASHGTSARAQLITAGSTPQGDYLRGVGIAAMGMGSYNLNTARAESINVDTFIRFNEYVAAVVKEQTRQYIARKLADATERKEFYKQNRQRILESPEARDVENGDAMNAVLQQLLDSKVGESTFRVAEYQVPLPIDMIRRIPFTLSEKGEKFSMDRLSLKGKGKWTVALQDERFQREKKAYERALDKALEQAIDGKMQISAIDEVDARADDLFRRLNEVVGPSSDRLYIEAKERLNELKSTVRLLKTAKIERAIGEIDKYSGTTINDLKLFMLSHNLRFAAAKTPEERLLFPDLYARLVQQRDKVAIPEAKPDK